MRIYDFSLSSMHFLTGVDSAMCVRADILEKLGHEVKLIFPAPPYPRDLMVYTAKGLRHSQMLGVHSYFSDIHDYTPSADLGDTVAWLKNMLGCPEEKVASDRVVVTGSGGITAQVLLTQDQTGFYGIQYSRYGEPVRMDLYADVMYASIFYETKTTDQGRFAAAKGRCFYNRDGSVALTQLLWENEELNILPDGSVYNRDQLFELFVERLELTKRDVVILDKAAAEWFPAKPLLSRCDKTSIIAVVHSEHFYQKGLSVNSEYLNYEYWYWFKYSKYIQTMVVSTEEQNAALEETLREFGFAAPEIKTIPVVWLDRIRRPEAERKRKSVVCVARLNERKKIEWTIHTIIKAHDLDPEITLDIYGMGTVKYTQYLQELIRSNHASEYITLKGHRDNVADVYQQYEVFLTTSLTETFGITLLEAVGSGLAMVGLDVRYGNKLFIKDGQNGWLVPYDPGHIGKECLPEAELLAERVVDILSDEEKRRKFSEKSYEIAERYLPKRISWQWKELMDSYEAAAERK